MKFNYYTDLEEWAITNGYDADNFLDEETILQKGYSRIIRFYLLKDDGSYAHLTAYQSEEEGLFDIELIQEGLERTEELVIIMNAVYK